MRDELRDALASAKQWKVCADASRDELQVWRSCADFHQGVDVPQWDGTKYSSQAERAKRVFDAVANLRAERDALRASIATHRSQKADDRCIEDDDRLYESLRDGVKCDRRVGNKVEMLANCQRFIEQRCEAGGWASYAELEQERDELRVMLAGLATAGSQAADYLARTKAGGTPTPL